MKKIILITILLLSYFIGYSQSSYPFIAGYTPTTGDLLYYNGTKWVAIPGVAFVNGQALSGNGTGVAPSYKSLFGSLSGILMANGAGVLSVGVAGTNYVSPSITIGGTLPISGGGNLSSNRTLAISGLTTYGTANQIPGTNAGATGWEYKTITAGSNISVTHGVGTVTIAATGGSGTVTGITPGYGFTSATPITTSGTLTIDTSKVRSVSNSYSLATMQTKLDSYGLYRLPISGSFSASGTGTPTFTVPIGVSIPDNHYNLAITPTSAPAAAAYFYITNKTTTTFDLVYVGPIAGTVTLDWILVRY